MPLIAQPDYWTCEICGLAVGMVDNDTNDDDPGLPFGWLRIDVSELVENEDYTEWKGLVDTVVAQMVGAAQSALTVGPDGVPQSLTANDMGSIRKLAELQYPATIAQFVVEEQSFCLCAEHRASLSRLDIEDYGKEGATPTPVEALQEAAAATVASVAPLAAAAVAPAPVAVEPVAAPPAPPKDTP